MRDSDVLMVCFIKYGAATPPLQLFNLLHEITHLSISLTFPKLDPVAFQSGLKNIVVVV